MKIKEIFGLSGKEEMLADKVAVKAEELGNKSYPDTIAGAVLILRDLAAMTEVEFDCLEDSSSFSPAIKKTYIAAIENAANFLEELIKEQDLNIPY